MHTPATLRLSSLLPRTSAAIAAAAGKVPPARPYSYQSTNLPEKGTSTTYAAAQRSFYRDFGPPVAKVFLGALATYQVLYWGWLKLESLQMKEEKTGA